MFYLGGKDVSCLRAFKRQSCLARGPRGALEGCIKARPARCYDMFDQSRLFSRGRGLLKHANIAQLRYQPSAELFCCSQVQKRKPQFAGFFCSNFFSNPVEVQIQVLWILILVSTLIQELDLDQEAVQLLGWWAHSGFCYMTSPEETTDRGRCRKHVALTSTMFSFSLKCSIFYLFFYEVLQIMSSTSTVLKKNLGGTHMAPGP